jgi:hypothetical protein
MTRPTDHGPEELFRRMPDTGGDLQPTDRDVEGHRRIGPVFADEGEAPGAIRRIADDPNAPDDVEGHLYTGGPSTRGEFVRRAPGDGPHGEG